MPDSRLEIILAAKDLTDKAFGDVTGRLMAIERRVLSLGSVLGGFGLGFGVGALASHAEKTAESFEQLEAQLDILYRGKGKAVLEEINAWALDMPINTQKAVEAWVQMKALGFDPTIDRLQVLTDVATIFGEDVLKRITLQLGQMSAKGKVMAQDLNVLAEAGINARRYIMDAFGMTVDEIQESGIDIARVVEVLFKGMERDFGGSAKRMMSSWRGLKETAESYFVEIERRVMNAGLFDAMKRGLSSFNEEAKAWIANNESMLQQKIPEYVGQITASIEGLFNSTRTLVGIYSSLPDEITGAAGCGIIGRIVFGGWGPARIIAGIALINNTMHDYGMGLGDVARKSGETKTAFVNLWQAIYDVSTGVRDWHTGAYVEWQKAADGAADYWQRSKKAIADYQSDIERMLQNDPLNDFFARQKTQMSYFTSPATKLIRQINADQAKAAEEAKASAKKLAEEIKKAQEGFKTALMGPSRLEEYMAGGQHENAILRMEQERLARIREQGAKATPAQGGTDSDWITRHREEIGPYNQDLVKESESAFKSLIELSEHTAEAMQSNFSDLFFDAFTGQLDDLEDYAKAVFDSILRAMADMSGQMATQAIFGGRAVGSTQGAGGLVGWLTRLFGSSSGPELLNTFSALGNVFGPSGLQRFANGTVVDRPTVFPFAGGIGLMGEAGPEGILPLKRNADGRLGVEASGGAPSVYMPITVVAPDGRMSRESLSQVGYASYMGLRRAWGKNA